MPTESLTRCRRIGELALAGAATLLAAARPDSPSATATAETDVRRAVEAVIARSLAATRAKDIDAYMACIPDDWSCVDEAGHRVTRRELRENTLRDWKIIVATIAIEERVESLKLNSPTVATVQTAQRWERTMLERDGRTKDHVITTQRHREEWRLTAQGWRSYKVTELGGKVWVNGKPYVP